MVRFCHGILPLTTAVKIPIDKRGIVNDSYHFEQLVNLLINCHNDSLEDKSLEIHFDYNYESLFYTKFWKGKRISDLGPAHQLSILKEKTYWYPRLKPNMKLMVERLLNQRRGLLKLKEMLNLTDGVLSSLLLAVPELFMANDDPYGFADYIKNSIICNSLFNYDKTVKDIKKFRKHVKKAAFEGEMITSPHVARDHTWMNKIINFLNGLTPKDSKSFMFRIGILTQTRGSGLGGKGMVKESLDAFLEETRNPREFDPDQDMQDSIKEIISNAVVEFTGKNYNFRTSMSTSACTEVSKKDGGKFGLLKELVRIGTVSAPSINDTFMRGTKPTIGQELWEHSMHHMKYNRDLVAKCNFAGIREPAKVRSVLSGSGLKDAALQPFSHLTIEICKYIPELADAFTAGRLGYAALKRLARPAFQDSTEIFLKSERDPNFKKNSYIYSTDWTRATDTPSFNSGRTIMTTFFRVLGIAESTIDTIMSVWAGPRPIYIGQNKVGVMECGQQMGDPITKTNLCLAHPIIKRYARKKLVAKYNQDAKELLSVKFGNGDDDTEFIHCPREDILKDYIKFLEDGTRMLGYRPSEEDTFVSKWGTYCEEIFCIPIGSVTTASKEHNNMISPYLDIPKIRCLIDVKKDRADFSSDPIGKATLLGNDMEYMDRDGSHITRNIYSVASAIQDVSLGLRYAKNPVYLHRNILGAGKMVPHWDPESLHLAIKSQTRPFFRWASLKVMEEYVTDKFEIMNIKSTLVRDQKHFTKEKTLETVELPEDYFLRTYLEVKKTDWHLYPVGMLEKLIASRKLIPEREIRNFYLMCLRLETLSETPVDDIGFFDKVKNTITDQPEYDDTRSRKICNDFVAKFHGAHYALRYFAKEDLYSAEVLEHMDNYHPLKVTIDIPALGTAKPLRFGPRLWTSKSLDLDQDEQVFRFYKENKEMIESGLINTYIGDAVHQLSDDPIILQQVADGDMTFYIIVTDDLKLLEKLNRKVSPLKKAVFGFSAREYILNLLDDLPTRALESFFRRKYNLDSEVILDTGSISFFNSRVSRGEDNKFYHRGKLPLEWNDSIMQRQLVSNVPVFKAKTISLIKSRFHRRFNSIQEVIDHYSTI